jgi:hypothetical protein
LSAPAYKTIKLDPQLRLVNACSVSFDSNIILFGGYNRRDPVDARVKLLSYHDSEWIYESFSPNGTRPHDLEGHSMSLYRNSLVIFGGQTQGAGLCSHSYLLQWSSPARRTSRFSLDILCKCLPMHSLRLAHSWTANLFGPNEKPLAKKSEELLLISMDSITQEERIARGASGIVMKALVGLLLLLECLKADFYAVEQSLCGLKGLLRRRR